ncbi:hypothetical protein VNI00_005682 [Paramarasmius palmivorus]|uniref:C3H1-type domain-containing protein n=1 Tax=Paramarasmius palmivorus TaxID=297713 RepID=A0AAW0DAT4_9AGAR
MANSQVLPGSTAQLWDDEIRRLLSLANGTVQHNQELESRVAELELQVAVWKQAHTVAADACEVQKKQIATLNRQISSLHVFQTEVDPLILCLINGNETFFSKQFLEQGFQGGQSAAQLTTKAIAEHLSREDVQLSGRLSFWVILFINKIQLEYAFATHNICTPEQLDGFLAGFTQASPRFLSVDIRGEGACEIKIKGCFNVATSGGFAQLDTDGLLGKLVLLHSTIHELSRIQPYKIPSLQVDNLLVDYNRFVEPLRLGSSPPQISPFSAMSGGLVSPQSPTSIGSRFIDPSLPLHKRRSSAIPVFATHPDRCTLENPPPCNEHYLMTCSKGAGQCKYSHDYVLSPEQLSSLASNAKKAPCNWLKNGLQCPYGNKCCWGHVCPNGPKCFHLSKGKCWFKGADMHNVPLSPPLTIREC